MFTTPYQNPVGGNPEAVRANLRESARLLKEAGFEIKDRKLVDPDGQARQRRDSGRGSDRRTDRAVLQAVAGTHRRDRLDSHGRRRAVRKPAAQFRFRYHHRQLGRSRCRPATSSANSGVRSPPTRRDRSNTIGIKNPAVDALIEQVDLRQGSRDLVAATKALDRVLLWNFYVVPQFTYRHLALCALGPLRPRRAAAEIWPVPDSRRCGGSTPTRPPGSASALEGFSAHGAVFPPACARSRRRRARARRWLRPARRRRDAGRRGAWHIGVRRSEIPGRLSSLRLCQHRRAERRRCSR